MPLLLFIAGLFIPRFVIAMVWLLSDWFGGVFETRLFPILGFLFMPYTLLWYAAVEKWFAGAWTVWHFIILAIAIASDLSSSRKPKQE